MHSHPRQNTTFTGLFGGYNALFIAPHRFGFNGKENDNEVNGMGNHQDYGMRVYDTRLGRFLSIDPLTKDYPWYSPYQFAGNKPIWAVDLDGKEEFISTSYFNVNGNYLGTKIQIVGPAGMNRNNNGLLDMQIVHNQVATLDASGNVVDVSYTKTMIGSYASGISAFQTPFQAANVLGRNPNGTLISNPVTSSSIIITGPPAGGGAAVSAPPISLAVPILFVNTRENQGNMRGYAKAQKSYFYTSSVGSTASESKDQENFYFMTNAGNETSSPNFNKILLPYGKSDVPPDPANRQLAPGSLLPPDGKIGSPTIQR